MLRKSVPELLVSFLLVSIPLGCAVQGESKTEEATGTVIAYDRVTLSVTCIEVCESSLIVRLSEQDHGQAQYIRVGLKYHGRQNPPKPMIEGMRQWRFKLTRTVELDEQIVEFIKGEDVYGKGFNMPIWERVAGAEGEALPFGKTLPAYSMKKRDFRPVKGK